MNIEKKSLRIGAMAIACAILLRLGSNGALGAVVKALSSPEAVSLMLYLETGRVVKPALPEIPTQFATQLEEDEATVNVQPEEAPALPAFAEDDASLVEVNSVCGYDTDLPALLQQPLSWNLKQEAPTVLILHTHGTESYTKTEDYEESSAYRTLDTGYNVVSVGEELKRVLEAGGVRVIHDTTMHDYPSYSGSYSHARKQIRTYLDENPSIALVLDIHRDSVENSAGKQVVFTTQFQGQAVARMMMVVGTDANGLTHPKWPQNMALAVKMHALLEKNCPGICRPISFRSQRFNQDLSTGAMLIEVGSAGNTREQALGAVRILGETILELSQGTAS